MKASKAATGNERNKSLRINGLLMVGRYGNFIFWVKFWCGFHFALFLHSVLQKGHLAVAQCFDGE